MRNSKEALRHQVGALESELADRDAEIARLESELSDATASKSEGTGQNAMPSLTLDEVRIGKLRSDGRVRYVVQPVNLIHVGIAFAGAAAWTGTVASTHDGVLGVLLTIAAFVLMPLGFWNELGFDVDVTDRKILAWRSRGPFHTFRFTVRRPLLPEMRTAKEGSVTRLWWGSESLVTSLSPSALNALLKELSALTGTSKE